MLTGRTYFKPVIIMLVTCILLSTCLFFDPEDGDNMFFKNIGKLLPDYQCYIPEDGTP
jgi:hypothetical protein